MEDQIRNTASYSFLKGVDALSAATVGQLKARMSSAERAILEYLYDVPKQEGFDKANYIMESLASLRPNVLQLLLEACSSVRVKRLFMYMADYHYLIVGSRD